MKQAISGSLQLMEFVLIRSTFPSENNKPKNVPNKKRIRKINRKKFVFGK